LEVFDNITTLQQHLRQANLCPIVEDETEEMFIDARLAQQLRRRGPPAGLPKKSEYDKWREMYQLIFPDDEPIPSPCKCPCPASILSINILANFWGGPH